MFRKQKDEEECFTIHHKAVEVQLQARRELEAYRDLVRDFNRTAKNKIKDVFEKDKGSRDSSIQHSHTTPKRDFPRNIDQINI